MVKFGNVVVTHTQRQAEICAELYLEVSVAFQF